MGKKFVISESEISEIRKMYGLVTEQKYMKKYNGSLLNFCAYRAIERFEEIMGGPTGGTMGDDYFETRLETYELLIKANIEKTIGLNVFNSFPEKLKMQIWSWMFNNTDASQGTVKWLAGISQSINLDKFKTEKDGQEYRLKVANPNSLENSAAINQIKSFNGSWDEVYNNYLYVLDKQYVSTAENNNKQGSYDKSWKFRPSKLDEFYNECSSGKIEKKSTTPTKPIGKGIMTPVEPKEPVISAPSKKKEKITGKDLQEFLDNIRRETVGLKIDFDSVNIDMDKRELTFSLDETQEPVKRLTFAVNLPDEKTCESCVRIGEKNNVPDDKRIKGKFENGTRIFELFALY